MVNKCQQQVRPVQLHFRTLTWFVTKSESQPFIWRLFFVQRHSTAQSNCCTKWKSGARGAQALAEIPQEPQPPWRLWVWPVSLHSFGALFLFCGTQPHNPTAALHERAARGAKALAEIPQEPQPPRRCSLCGQFAPDDKVPLPRRQFIIFCCCCRLAMQEWKSWLKMLKFSKVPWLAKLVKNDTDLVRSSTPHHCLSSPHVPFYGRQALAITRSNLSDGARFGACTTVCWWYFRHHFALGLHGKPCTSSALNHSFFCIKGLDEAGWHDINCQFLEWYGSGRSWSGKVWKQSTSSKLENALSARFACKYVVVIVIQNI